MSHPVYSDQFVTEIESRFADAVNGLQELQLRCVELSHQTQAPRVREYLTHGVGRRLRVLRNSLLNIFRFFPLNTKKPLPDSDLIDAQGNLHAFVINLSGLLDNFAWLYVFRHDLQSRIGDRRNVGLLKTQTSRFFPQPLKRHLAEPGFMHWHDQYLKDCRDALAHRIALYIPPATWTQEEGNRYADIDRRIHESIQTRDFERVEELRKEQDELGLPCFSFLHSFTDSDKLNALRLHPQVVADADTVNVLGRIFFDCWEHPPD